MRRVIGIDIHRTFGEVVIWDNGELRHAGRVDMTRTALEGLGKRLRATDEVVIEATGNSTAVSRVLLPCVARVVIANPLQVKAIAYSHVKTDKIDAGTLASLHAAGYLPEIWTPDAVTERKRRLVARRYQVVRHRTQIKNEVHSMLYAHLIPKCPHADLFSKRGREWLARQPLPDDERMAADRHVRELDRLAEDLALLDREIAQVAIEDPAVKRLMTITGVNLTVAAGIVAAIGDIGRFKSPQKLVSYFGLNPRVRQSGLGVAHHGRISKVGRSHARAMLVEAAWATAKSPGPLHAFFVRIRARRGHQPIAWPPILLACLWPVGRAGLSRPGDPSRSRSGARKAPPPNLQKYKKVPVAVGSNYGRRRCRLWSQVRQRSCLLHGRFRSLHRPPAIPGDASAGDPNDEFT